MFIVVEHTSRQTHKHTVQLCYRLPSLQWKQTFFSVYSTGVFKPGDVWYNVKRKTHTCAPSPSLDISWIPPLRLYLPGSGQVLPRSSSLLNLHSPPGWRVYAWQKAGCGTTSWRKRTGTDVRSCRPEFSSQRSCQVAFSAREVTWRVGPNCERQQLGRNKTWRDDLHEGDVIFLLLLACTPERIIASQIRLLKTGGASTSSCWQAEDRWRRSQRAAQHRGRTDTPEDCSAETQHRGWEELFIFSMKYSRNHL